MTESRQTTTTETVASVRARQSVWVTWMAEATAGLADTDLVEATTDRTPFGNYLVALAPVAR